MWWSFLLLVLGTAQALRLRQHATPRGRGAHRLSSATAEAKASANETDFPYHVNSPMNSSMKSFLIKVSSGGAQSFCPPFSTPVNVRLQNISSVERSRALFKDSIWLPERTCCRPS